MATPARHPLWFSYKYRGGPRGKKKDQERGKRTEGRREGEDREKRGEKAEKRKEEAEKKTEKYRGEREGKRRATAGHPTVSAASCRHQQLCHRRQPPQVSPLPLILFYCSSSCMQNVHCARSASHELLTRLLCINSLVTVHTVTRLLCAQYPAHAFGPGSAAQPIYLGLIRPISKKKIKNICFSIL